MNRPDQSTISCRGRTGRIVALPPPDRGRSPSAAGGNGERCWKTRRSLSEATRCEPGRLAVRWQCQDAIHQRFHIQRRCARQTSSRAFTLIELLVVIAIIGVLAGLIIGVGPGAYNKKVQSRVRTELEGLITVIESYKATKDHYPPDNTNNPAQPPLFYELTGTISTDDGDPITYRTINGQESIVTSNVKGFFGIEGFANSDADKENVKNFYPNLKPSQFKEISSAPDVEVLVVPYKGPTGNLNPWRYNSSNPVHNPGSYDLWAEIVMGGKTNIIGNWKD